MRAVFLFLPADNGAAFADGIGGGGKLPGLSRRHHKKHEFTRPDKEDDRVRHIEALNSQTGPVLLFHRALKEWSEFTARHVAETPDIDFTAKDGIRHSSWTVREPGGDSVRAGDVCPNTVSLYRRRASSQRGGGAGG